MHAWELLSLVAWLAAGFAWWLYFSRWDNRIYLKAYTKMMEEGKYLSFTKYAYKERLQEFPELRSERKRMNNLSLGLAVVWLAVLLVGVVLLS